MSDRVRRHPTRAVPGVHPQRQPRRLDQERAAARHLLDKYIAAVREHNGECSDAGCPGPAAALALHAAETNVAVPLLMEALERLAQPDEETL